MKIVGLVASLLLSFISFSQKSYYFSNPLPLEEIKLTKVDAKHYGTYSSIEQPSHYEIDENGIALVSTNIASVSRETIRESSKYTVRNGFIHGVIKDDSLPCVLKGEYYFFGVQNREIIVGKGSQNVLKRIDAYGNYIVSVFENGSYIPLKISFSNGKFSIAYFDYDFDTKLFKFINDQESVQESQYELVILSPSEKEVKRLLRVGMFGENKVFEKAN
ncbi:MAG TPA: hypothetical protein EYG86_00350 [Crocinitomicaceae bacterium]|nr:hypothetical protein [Crocinitomicaceae bacterium]